MDGLHGTLEDIIRTLDQPSYNESVYRKHNRYDDNMQYSDMDDDDDDDDEEEEETLRNMFSQNMDSSSEDEYSDENIASNEVPTDYQHLHFRGTKAQSQHDKDHSLVEGELEELPNWFVPQTFQYSRLMILPLLSGAPLVLLMGGEMLLAVIALGALITHLINDAGLAKGASSACMMSTVCALIVVVYNLAPLVIWRSLWYFILLAAAVGYITLTGSWILLLMIDFCRTDPHLALYLESMLFTVYPSVTIVLSTWAVSMLIGYQFSPYVLLVTGFLFYRVFVKPFSSSFVDTECTPEIKSIVIDPWSSAVLACFLTVAPSVLYLTISLYSAATYSALLAISMNVLTILAVSFFVTTFLHLKPTLEVYDFPMEKVILLRKLAVVVSIICWTLGLHFHGYQSVLLPHWPLVFMCAWSLLGLALSKNQKLQSVIFTVNLTVLIVVLMLQMPWSLKYSIGKSGWMLQHVYMALILNAVMCSLAVYSSKYMSKELFSFLLVIHSVVFSHQMTLLYQSHLMSTTTMILVHLFCVYFLIRMQRVKKCLWQCALFSVTVHTTVLMVTMETIYISSKQNWTAFIFHFFALFLLLAVTVYITVIEMNEVIDFSMFIKYISAVALLSLICIYQQPALLASLAHYERSSHKLLGLGLVSLITSIPALKLSFYHCATNNTTWRIGALLLVSGVTLLTVQPSITADMFDIVRLLLFTSVIGGCVLIAVIPRTKSYTVLYGLCLITGSSLGTFLYSVMFTDLHIASIAMYGMQATLLFATGVTCLKPTATSDHHLFILSVTTSSLALIMAISDILSYGFTIGPGRMGAVPALVVVAMTAKFHSVIQLPQVSKETYYLNYMPTVGNISTVLCMVLLLSLTQLTKIPSDLWMLLSTSVLFLLQKDEKLSFLKNLNQHNHITPSAAAIIILLATSIIYQSPVFLPERGFFHTLCAVAELIVLLLTLPVLLVLFIVLWYGQFHTLQWYKSSSQVMAILYLTPFFFCLILMPISTTYRSWIYAVLGIASGTYLWQTMIPLSLL